MGTALPKEQLPELIEEAVHRYYEGNYDLALSLMEEHCIFISAGPVFYLRDDVKAALQNNANRPTFTLHDCRFRLVETQSEDEALVMGEFTIRSDPGFDMVVAGHQRVTVSMRLQGDRWQAYLIHASNEYGEADAEGLFPANLGRHTFEFVQEILQQGLKAARQTKRIHLETGGSSILVDPDSILYVESAGKQCILHFAEHDTTVRIMLGEVQDMLPTYFVRIHRYYLVNVKYVFGISRSGVELIEGTVLPIPERRFANVKAELLERVDIGCFAKEMKDPPPRAVLRTRRIRGPFSSMRTIRRKTQFLYTQIRPVSYEFGPDFHTGFAAPLLSEKARYARLSANLPDNPSAWKNGWDDAASQESCFRSDEYARA